MDVASKRYDTTTSVTWQEHPGLPVGVIEILEANMPLRQDEPLEKPTGGLVEVLASRRLHHAGDVEIIRFKRFLTTTIVACGGYLFKLPRAVANAIRDDWLAMEALPQQRLNR